VVDHLTQNSIMWKKLIEFDNYIGLVLTK
jgi:hypothetical protein